MESSEKSTQHICVVRIDLIEKVIIEEREKKAGQSHVLPGGRMMQAEEI